MLVKLADLKAPIVIKEMFMYTAVKRSIFHESKGSYDKNKKNGVGVVSGGQKQKTPSPEPDYF